MHTNTIILGTSTLNTLLVEVFQAITHLPPGKVIWEPAGGPRPIHPHHPHPPHTGHHSQPHAYHESPHCPPASGSSSTSHDSTTTPSGTPAPLSPEPALMSASFSPDTSTNTSTVAPSPTALSNTTSLSQTAPISTSPISPTNTSTASLSPTTSTNTTTTSPSPTTAKNTLPTPAPPSPLVAASLPSSPPSDSLYCSLRWTVFDPLPQNEGDYIDEYPHERADDIDKTLPLTQILRNETYCTVQVSLWGNGNFEAAVRAVQALDSNERSFDLWRLMGMGGIDHIQEEAAPPHGKPRNRYFFNLSFYACFGAAYPAEWFDTSTMALTHNLATEDFECSKETYDADPCCMS